MEKKLIVLVGLPGSGKSYYAKKYAEEHDSTEIVSSDEVRRMLYGSPEIQGNSNDVFATVYDMVNSLLSDYKTKTVILDATNISKKRRIHFIKNILHKYESVRKECHWILRPYSECVYLDSTRKNPVGENVIKKMYMEFSPPHKHEGFDDVVIVKKGDDIENIYDFVNRMKSYDQDNSHHTLSLGEHLEKCFQNAFDLCYLKRVAFAAILHDCGKPFCYTHKNKKDEVTEDAHYYNHENVGSYDSALYLIEDKTARFTDDFICDVSNIIYYHMKPYTSWKQSEKALQKDIALIGEDMYKDIMCLHDADVKSH